MELKISSLFRVVIAVLAITSIGAFGFLESAHPYIDFFSIGLVLLFSAILYFFSGRFSDRYPPAIIITLLLILFVQLRICVLIFLPDSLLNSANITYEVFNSTLGYMIIGTVACYLGLAFGYGNNGGLKQAIPQNDLHSDDFGLRFLSVAFGISLALGMIIYSSLGYVGATGDSAHLGFFQRYIARLIYPVGWLVMFMSAYALHPHRKSYNNIFLALLVLYVMSFVLSGSRGGIFEVIILLLSYKLITEGNFKFRLSGWRMALLLGLIPLSLMMYWFATQLRAYWYGGDVSIMSIIDMTLANANGIEVSRAFISDVSYRLSFLEPTICSIFAQEIGLNDVSELVNINTTILSAINRLIPGKPFGDILFTEYAYGFIYEPQNGVLAYSESGRIDHVGYEWTIFGISYQLFGYIGGVLFIFGATAILSRIIRKFNAWNNFYGLSCGIFFMGILSVWIRNLGIDNLVDRAVHGFILLCINFAGYWLIVTYYTHLRTKYSARGSL